MSPKAQGQSGNIMRPRKKVGRGEREREREGACGGGGRGLGGSTRYKIQSSVFYLYTYLFGLTGLGHCDFLAVVG